jgi:hypothetical protein
MRRYVLLIAAGLAVAVSGCATGQKATVQVNPSVRADAEKVLMMPAFGINSDEATASELENQLTVAFKPLPGSSVARQAGLYDKLRPQWEKAMQSMINDPSGSIDRGFVEVLSKIGQAANVDALLVSVVQGSGAGYEKKEEVCVTCGLFDLRDKAYRWIGTCRDRKGLVPVPFKAFMANSVNNIAGEVKNAKQ